MSSVVDKEKKKILKDISDSQSSIPNSRISTIDAYLLYREIYGESNDVQNDINTVDNLSKLRALFGGNWNISTSNDINVLTNGKINKWNLTPPNTQDIGITNPSNKVFGCFITYYNDTSIVIDDINFYKNKFLVKKDNKLVSLSDDVNAYLSPVNSVINGTLPIQNWQEKSYKINTCVNKDGNSYISIKDGTSIQWVDSEWKIYSNSLLINQLSYLYTPSTYIRIGTLKIYLDGNQILHQDENGLLILDGNVDINLELSYVNNTKPEIYLVFNTVPVGNNITIKYSTLEAISQIPTTGMRSNYTNTLSTKPDENSVSIGIMDIEQDTINFIGVENNGNIEGDLIKNSSINRDTLSKDYLRVTVNFKETPINGSYIIAKYDRTENMSGINKNTNIYNDSFDTKIYPNTITIYLENNEITKDNGTGNFIDNNYINGELSNIDYTTGNYTIVFKDTIFNDFDFSPEISVKAQTTPSVEDINNYLDTYQKATFSLSKKVYLSNKVLMICTLDESLDIEPDLNDLYIIRDENYQNVGYMTIFSEGLKINNNWNPLSNDSSYNCMEVLIDDFKSLFNMEGSGDEFISSTASVSTSDKPENNPFFPYCSEIPKTVNKGSVSIFKSSEQDLINDVGTILEPYKEDNVIFINGEYYSPRVPFYPYLKSNVLHPYLYTKVYYDKSWLNYELPYTGTTPNIYNYFNYDNIVNGETSIDNLNSKIYNFSKFNFYPKPLFDNDTATVFNNYNIESKPLRMLLYVSLSQIANINLIAPDYSNPTLGKYTVNVSNFILKANPDKDNIKIVYSGSVPYPCIYTKLAYINYHSLDESMKLLNIIKNHFSSYITKEQLNEISNLINSYNSYINYFNNFNPTELDSSRLNYVTMDLTYLNTFKNLSSNFLNTYIEILDNFDSKIGKINSTEKTGLLDKIYKYASAVGGKITSSPYSKFKTALDSEDSIYGIIDDKRNEYKELP